MDQEETLNQDTDQVDDRTRAGREIVQTMDQMGLGVEGAIWIQHESVQRWAFHLFTPLVDTMGPRWIYERLLKVFQKVPLPDGLTPLDVVVRSPSERWFQALPIYIDVSKTATSSLDMRRGFGVGDFKVERCILLRKLQKAPSATPRAFDLKVRRLQAA
jgi:hypothetical protein